LVLNEYTLGPILSQHQSEWRFVIFRQGPSFLSVARNHLVHSLPRKPDVSALTRELKPTRTLDDLLLSAALRETLERLKRERERSFELAQNNLRPRNRLLFYGMPGNGKTRRPRGHETALKKQEYRLLKGVFTNPTPF